MNKKHLLLMILASVLSIQISAKNLHELILEGSYTFKSELEKNDYSKEQLNTKDNDGNTVLHIAAKKGYDEIVNTLLLKGVPVNGKNNKGLTPLHFAAKKDQLKTCKLLIQYNAEIESKDNEGLTPLCYATLYFNSKTVNFFLEKNANASIAVTYEKENLKQVPLLNTICLGNYGQFNESFLNRKRIAVNLIKYFTKKNPYFFYQIDTNGKTALHLAVENDHSELVSLFLGKGFNPTIKDEYGLVPGDYTDKKHIHAMLKKYAKDFQK